MLVMQYIYLQTLRVYILTNTFTLEFVKNMAMHVLLCINKLLSALFSLKRKEL